MKRKILIVIALLLLCFCLFGCSEKSEKTGSAENEANTGYNTEENQDTAVPAEELSGNVKASGAVDKKGKLVVIAQNKNNTNIDLEIEVEFYDSKDNIVGSDSESFYGVGAGGEVAAELYSTPEKFDKYKIFADAKQTDTVCYYDKVKLSHNNNGEDIVVQLTNESKEEVGCMSVCVVYYRDDKIVGADDGTESDIKPGRSANFNINYPYSKNYKNVSVDKYRVFINEAYTW